jgi:hypothetical protein
VVDLRERAGVVGYCMTDLSDIQRSIEKLPPQEVARLREWLEELDARLFDQRIESDAKSGKLDKLAEKALADHRAGRTREL